MSRRLDDTSRPPTKDGKNLFLRRLRSWVQHECARDSSGGGEASPPPSIAGFLKHKAANSWNGQNAKCEWYRKAADLQVSLAQELVSLRRIHPAGKWLASEVLLRYVSPEFPLGLLLDLNEALATPEAAAEVPCMRTLSGNPVMAPVVFYAQQGGLMGNLRLELVGRPEVPGLDAALQAKASRSYYPCPESFFTFRDEAWLEAEQKCARFLEREGLWREESDIRFRITPVEEGWDERQPIDALVGDSLGAMMALAGAGLIAPESKWGGHWRSLPVHAIAVSGAIDEEGRLFSVGAAAGKVTGVAMKKNVPLVEIVALPEANMLEVTRPETYEGTAFTRLGSPGSSFSMNYARGQMLLTFPATLQELVENVQLLWERTHGEVAADRAATPPPLPRSRVEEPPAGRAVPTSKKGRRERARLISKIEKWLEASTSSMLAEGNRLDIQFVLAPEAVLNAVDIPSEKLPSNTDFGLVFHDLQRDFVVLGEPGGGKTTLLLQLAKSLLARAKENAALPVPLVLNLSSWTRQRKPLGRWIVEEASRYYQLPLKLVQRWLETRQIVPLLDGLDEVATGRWAEADSEEELESLTEEGEIELRRQCLRAVQQYGKEGYRNRIVVACRSTDYEALQTALDHWVAIRLLPLDPLQVEKVLKRPQLDALRAVREQEWWIHPMSRSPFLLNTMCRTYAGMTEAALRLPGVDQHPQGRMDHLMSHFINQRLDEVSEDLPYTPKKAYSLLSWLSASLWKQGENIFYIENLQKSALSKFDARWLYCALSRWLFGIFAGLCVWVAFYGITQLDFWRQSKIGNNAIVTWVVPLIFASLAASGFFFNGVGAALLEWGRSSYGVKWTALFFRWLRISLLSACLLHLYWVATPSYIGAAANNSFLEHIQISLGALLAAGGILGIPFGRAENNGGVWGTLMSLAYSLVVALAMLTGPLVMNQSSTADLLTLSVTMVPILLLMRLFKDEVASVERLGWQWNTKAALVCGLWMAASSWSMVRPEQGGNNMNLGSSAGLMFVIGGIVFGLKRSKIISLRTRPNQGIISSLVKGLYLVLLVELSAALLYVLLYSSRRGDAQTIDAFVTKAFFFGVIFAGFSAMVGGLDTVIKHGTLRALLRLTESVPLRLQRSGRLYEVRPASEDRRRLCFPPPLCPGRVR